MKEIGENKKDVLFVPPSDAAALASALLRYLDDPELAARIAGQGSTRSRAFSVEKNVEALEKLYAEMANGRK